MDRRVLKIGNFVQDAKTQGYAIRVGISEMHYTELFKPIKLTDEFFLANEFKMLEIWNDVTGEKNYYRQDEAKSVVAHQNKSGSWDIDIRNGQDFRYIGKLTTIHEVQNALSECFIYWKIKA